MGASVFLLALLAAAPAPSAHRRAAPADPAARASCEAWRVRAGEAVSVEGCLTMVARAGAKCRQAVDASRAVEAAQDPACNRHAQKTETRETDASIAARRTACDKKCAGSPDDLCQHRCMWDTAKKAVKMTRSVLKPAATVAQVHKP